VDLIDRLEDLVTAGTKVPMTGRVMVEGEEFLACLDLLRQAMPSEFRQARRVIQDRQKIVLEAQAEAQKIVGVARERAEYLISERGLMSEAKVRSEEQLRQAREQARKSAHEVDHFALGILDKVERAIHQSREDMDRAMLQSREGIERAIREGLDDITQAKESLTRG
jgi:hypothetical protein